MDSIFPFISPETVGLAQTPGELPVFAEYAYDFAGNCLLLRDGKTYLVEGNDALRIWIYKTLHTRRYAHIAYSRAYGNEAHTLLGHALHTDILLPELQRYITECLMVNPYIRELKNFDFEVEGSKVTVRFDCTTLYGDMERQAYYYDEGSVG